MILWGIAPVISKYLFSNNYYASNIRQVRLSFATLVVNGGAAPDYQGAVYAIYDGAVSACRKLRDTTKHCVAIRIKRDDALWIILFEAIIFNLAAVDI